MNDQRMTTELEGATAPAQRTLAEAAFEEGRRLAADPNIRGVGYGAKIRDGASVRGGSLVFFVDQKLTTAEEIEARGSWPIPSAIAGFSTDVVEVGQLRAATADRGAPVGTRGGLVVAPLVGGTATMGLGTSLQGPGGYGTLGGLAFDSVTNGPLLLSNAHLWSANAEVVQPVMATTVFGAAATPAAAGATPATVLTRIPTALAAPVAFAGSVSQTYLIAGADADPLPFGQGATPVPATTRTDSEQVTIAAPAAGFTPTGRRVSPVVSWVYQRFANTAVLQASSSAARAPTKLLAARRLFTNAASYTAGQTVNLYAEVVPAAGGLAGPATAHHALVLLYPVPAGDRFVPRLLRPTTRQAVTAVTAQFTGFPAPARPGAVNLPFVVAGTFTVDSDGPGTFQAATAGTLPAGTLALKLPANTVRLFVPPSTQVTIDVDRRTAPAFAAQGINSAGDNAGTTTIPAPGSTGRTSVTISGSEIVEVQLIGAGTAILYGLTSNRASPEAAAPLCYAGSVGVSSLASGQWAASLFVQALDGGLTESANIVETAIGQAALIADCKFTVA
jgi:hypothetical protein